MKPLQKIIPPLLAILFLSLDTLHAELNKPNVLFISADDLRMNLGCYGDGPEAPSSKWDIP